MNKREELENGIKLKLSNGLDASVFSITSKKMKKVATALARSPAKGEHKSLAQYTVVKVYLKDEAVNLLYGNEVTTATLINSFQSGVRDGLTYVVGIVYLDTVYTVDEPTGKALLKAVMLKVSPHVATTLFTQPRGARECNTV
jgi:hypothetical protein